MRMASGMSLQTASTAWRGLLVLGALTLGCTGAPVEDEDAGVPTGLMRRDGGGTGLGFDAGKPLPALDAGEPADAADRPMRDDGGGGTSSGGGASSSGGAGASSSGGASSSSSSSSSSGGGGLCMADTLEPNNTPAAAPALANGSYNLSICPADADYFKVNLAAGQSFGATVTHASADGLLTLTVYQADATVVGSSSNANGMQAVNFSASQSGTYYVGVRNQGAAASIPYALVMNAGTPPVGTCSDDALEPNDSTGNANAVTPGTLQGRICPGDPDVFRVDLNVGDTLTATLASGGSGPALLLDVLSDQGAVLASGTGSQTRTATFTSVQSGPHFVRVQGGAPDENTYTLTVAVQNATGACVDDGQEPNDTTGTAASVAVGTLTATLCPGDDDFYALTANTGDALRVQLTPPATANLDVVLTGPNGDVLATGTMMGADTLLATAAQSGRHVVQVRAAGSLSAAAAYTLVLERTPAANACVDDAFEENDAQSTARPLAAGTHQATLCNADEDWFAFTLGTGDRLEATLTFDDANDLDLFVLGPDGVVLDSSDGVTGTEVVAITAATAGAYAVRVVGYGDAEGAYTLVASVTPAPPTCADDAFEENDTRAAARTIASGMQDARICPGDEDFYGVALNAGDTLTAAVSFTHGATSDLDVVLLSPAGAVLAQSSNGTGAEQVASTAVTAGTYVVRVFGRNGGAAPYQLNVTVMNAAPTCTDDAFEENDNAAAATSIAAGSLDGRVCAGDEDWFKVTLGVGDTLKADLTFTHSAGDLDLKVLSSAGTQVASSTSASNTESITYTPTVAGTYSIRVYGFRATTTNTYALAVRVDAAVPVCTEDAQEPNDSAAAARALTAGTTGNLRSCGGDDDFFTVALGTGDTLSVNLTTATAGQNVDLQLLSSTGTVLVTSAGASGNETAQHVATTAGNVAIRVFSAAGVAADYTFAVTITPSAPTCTDDAREPNNTQAGANVVTPGTLSALQVCPGNDDFYAVDVPAGGTLTASITFTVANGDLDLALLGPTGTVLRTSATASASTESVSYTFTTATRATLRAYGYQGVGNAYALTVGVTSTATCTDDGAEPNDTQAAAAALTPGTLTGTVCPGDPDFFSLTIPAGSTLSASLMFTNANGDLDLRLYNAAGSIVASSTTASQSTESFMYTATTAGTFALEVRGFLSATNSYTLVTGVTAASSCTDDAEEQNDTATAAKVVPGSPAALTVCPNDDDWFRVTLIAGEALTASITFTAANGDLDLRLYDAAGATVLDSSATSAGTERVDYVAPTARDVLLRVSGAAGARNSYSLTHARSIATLACPADDSQEQNDNRQTASPLQRDTVKVAQVCAGDEDWWTVALERGDRVTLNMSPNSGTGDLDLYLVGPDGNVAAPLATSDNTGAASETISYTATAPGAFFVRVVGFSGASNRYALHAAVVEAAGACQDDAAENNDTQAQARTFAGSHLDYPRDTVAGQVCASDDDWFDVYVFSDEKLVVDLKYAQDLGDLDLEIVREDGTVALSRSGVNGTERAEYLPTVAGYAYIRVKGFSGSFGPYTLITEVTAR